MIGLEYKVLVIGRHEAGKTSIMKRMIKEEVLTIEDSKGSTIALDYGNIAFDSVKIHFFGTPGQERFRFIVNMLSKGVDLVLLVVDSSKGLDSSDEWFLQYASRLNLPIVVAINKLDLNKELPAIIEYRIKSYFPSVTAVKTSAKTGEGIAELLYSIINNLSISQSMQIPLLRR